MTEESPSVGTQTAQRMLAVSRKLAAGVTHLRAVDAGREGCSDYEVVMQRGPARLLAYSGDETDPARTPVLIVYALVNRPYILDLQPGRSLIRRLLERRRAVYLVDWGYPGVDQRDHGFQDYVVNDLDAFAEYVLARHRTRALDLLGVCQGGTMGLCRAAIRPHEVRRLVLLVTPVDFHCDDFVLSSWLRYVDVDAMVARLGNIPGGLLNWAFLALKPMSLSNAKARDFVELMDSPQKLDTYVRMEHWIRDSPDQAATAFRDFYAAFFRDNALINGGLTLDGKAVRLSDLRCPVLNIHAASDHIVPPPATEALADFVPTARYASRSLAGGHIGLFAGRRSGAVVGDTINTWLDETIDPA